ncbi:hypothetical protein R9X47_27025 [Wukongibacter baidiensis]|uniref:hypothetical protein n=1 Tax=Wukongibacter baidiensis TaxID=1723361 RepID=UPI003D7FB0B5
MTIIILFFIILILMGALALGFLFVSIAYYNFKNGGKRYDSRGKNLVKKDFKVGIVLIVVSFTLVYRLVYYLLSL